MEDQKCKHCRFIFINFLVNNSNHIQNVCYFYLFSTDLNNISHKRCLHIVHKRI